MKIDEKTLSILKNFAKINPSIMIVPGNIISTVNSARTLMAKATVPTTFSQKFAVYELDRFLSVLSLFDNPDLTFHETFVEIYSNKMKTKFVYTSENLINKPSNKQIKLPSVDVSFNLTEANLKDIDKALNILSLTDIVIRGDGEKLTIQAVNINESTANQFSIELGQTSKIFTVIFKSENLKLIAGNYDVEICSKGISRFYNEDIEYYVAIEQNSSFE